jgi:hypothetical protein
MKTIYDQLKESIKDNPVALKLLAKYKYKKDSQLVQKNIDIENNLLQQQYLMNNITILQTNELINKKDKNKEKCIPDKLVVSVNSQQYYDEEKELLYAKIREIYSDKLIPSAGDKKKAIKPYLISYVSIVKNEVSSLKTKIKKAKNGLIKLFNEFGVNTTSPLPSLIKSLILNFTSLGVDEDEGIAYADETEDFKAEFDSIEKYST